MVNERFKAMYGLQQNTAHSIYSDTAVNISKEGRTQDSVLLCNMVVQLQQPDVPKPTSRNSQKTVRRRQPALSGYLQGTMGL